MPACRLPLNRCHDERGWIVDSKNPRKCAIGESRNEPCPQTNAREPVRRRSSRDGRAAPRRGAPPDRRRPRPFRHRRRRCRRALRSRDETRERSGRNNPDKFPPDYLFELDADELDDLRTKISSTNLSSKRRALPKAFTEKGLYMLATVLKSRRATETTFAIIETFAKVRALKRDLVALHEEPDAEKKAARARRFGELLADVVMPDADAVETESSLELNFLVGKIKHVVKKIRRNPSAASRPVQGR